MNQCEICKRNSKFELIKFGEIRICFLCKKYQTQSRGKDIPISKKPSISKKW